MRLGFPPPFAALLLVVLEGPREASGWSWEQQLIGEGSKAPLHKFSHAPITLDLKFIVSYLSTVVERGGKHTTGATGSTES